MLCDEAIDAALLSQCAGRRLLMEGTAQRTASMPRGLAAAFIVFAFIVFLLVSSSSKASSSSSCARRQQVKRQQYCDER